MTKQHRRTWQRHEQHVAAALGAQRKQYEVIGWQL
jgi:hypothetical protein